MNRKLFLQAIGKFLLGLLLAGALLFVPAGSFHYWQGWLFIGILFVPMFGAGMVLMVKKPGVAQKALGCQRGTERAKGGTRLKRRNVFGSLYCGGA